MCRSMSLQKRIWWPKRFYISIIATMIELKQFQDKFLEKGYNVRTFDPAGQDDIGGGCGQLWYVQRWLKSHQ